MIGQKIAERINQTSQLNVFQEMDCNHDGYISLKDLKPYLLKIGLRISYGEILTFLEDVDFYENNKMDIKEFLTFVLSGCLYQEMDTFNTNIKDSTDFTRKRFNTYPNKTIEDFIPKMMDKIWTYMISNKLSFLQFFERIDKNRNNLLSKSEFNEFLKKIECDISLNQRDALFNHFDENKNNEISIIEFVSKIMEFLSKRESNDDEDTELAIDPLNKKIIEYISQYLVENKIGINDFFISIDKNKDGVISRNEFYTVLRKNLKIILTQDEESTFFNYLDQNRNNMISIHEFNFIMKPAIEKARSKFSKTNLLSTTDANLRTSEDFCKSLKMAMEVFGKIGKVIHDSNISLEDAFDYIDYDGDGIIDCEKLFKAFCEMKLKYTVENVKDIINVIGIEGKVNIVQFINAIEEYSN